jgi:hypothetical protein
MGRHPLSCSFPSLEIVRTPPEYRVFMTAKNNRKAFYSSRSRFPAFLRRNAAARMLLRNMHIEYFCPVHIVRTTLCARKNL